MNSRFLSSLSPLLWSIRFWLVVSLLWAAILAWGTRHVMNPDGLSYLDIATDFLNAAPKDAVNSYWSPLYSLMIAGVLAVFQPQPAHEFHFVKGLNYVIFVLAALSFSFFLREWLRTRQTRAEEEWRDDRYLVPLAFVIFFWFTINYITLYLMTPDLTVACIVFLAAGICCRIAGGRGSWLQGAALGCALAAGYYAKAAMAVAAALLFLVLLVWPPLRAGRRWVLWAILVFCIVCAPLVALLSNRAGRFSIGESSRLNYIWHVNKLHAHTGWIEGDGGISGSPRRHPRVVTTKPLLLEFASPVRGTYPLWYDPSYWYEGATVQRDVRQQVAAVRRNLDVYNRAARGLGGVVAGGVVLWLLARKRAAPPGRAGPERVLLFWSLGMLAAYALVVVELRYVGAFAVLVCIALYGNFLRRVERSIGPVVAALVATSLLVPLVLETGDSAVQTAREFVRGARPPVHELVAARLLAGGVRRGDRLAHVGQSFHAYSVRMVGARIVAEIPDPRSFWRLGADELENLNIRLRELGVKAWLTDELPDCGGALGWEAVPGTRSGILFLR